MLRRQLLQSAAGLATASGALAAPRMARAQDARVMNFEPYADVAVTDPVWTTAYTTRTHALAVFDTLYGTDENLDVHPQMVAGHVVEQDGRLWRLTLRDGLVFHDGSKVLARDCVASIRRWGRRDSFGQALMAATDEIAAPDDKTIVFRLKHPFPLLPVALGRASSLVPGIMPERLAQTDPFTQVPEVIGSGPFRFVPDERVPGARVVYARHQGYVPRADGTASFTAGPRVAHFDRVVFNVIPDASTAASALMSGAADWVEQPLIDLLPMLKRDRNLVVEVKDSTGMVGCLRFNHLLPPFDKPEIRRILLSAVSQSDCMTAVAGEDRSLWKDGVGIFAPASPMASAVARPAPDYPALKRALQAAGYQGEKVVMLVGADVPRINAVCEVMRGIMTEIGFNLDFVTADWGTVISRITSRQPTDKGGWNCYCTYWSGMDHWSPATHAFLRGNGAQATTGWPTSPRIEELREQWLSAPDLAAQQSLAKQMQVQADQDVPYLPLGVFIQPVAYRKSLAGMLRGAPVFTNLRKA